VSTTKIEKKGSCFWQPTRRRVFCRERWHLAGELPAGQLEASAPSTHPGTTQSSIRCHLNSTIAAISFGNRKAGRQFLARTNADRIFMRWLQDERRGKQCEPEDSIFMITRLKVLFPIQNTVNAKTFLGSRLIKMLLLIFIVVEASVPLHAALIVSDDFNSVNLNSQIVGSSGGTGWNGSQWYNNHGGQNVYVSSTTPLTYSGLQTSGHKVTAASNGNNQGAYRYMGTQNPSTAAIWISVLMQSTGSGGYGGISLFNGDTSEQMFFGQRNGQSVFGIEKSGGSSNNSGQSSSTLSYLVVELTATTAFLWINPATGSTAPSTGSAFSINYTAFTFDTVRLQADNGTSENFGNLRFGTSFGDVSPVPEPITLALPIFGGLMVTAGLARRFVSRRIAPVV
jgi:hypothetical protein